MEWSKRVTMCAAVIAASAGMTNATVTGVTGQAKLIGAPPSATFPAILARRAQVWNERVNVTAPAGGFVVNMLVNGGTMSSTAPVGGVVTGVVDSHFIHWSPLFGRSASGVVTFSDPIVGVMYNDLWLNQSDGALGAAGTAYPVGTAAIGRGMHPSVSVVLASGNTLRFDFQRPPGNRVEQVRVLTRPVPGPGGVCVAALGLMAGMRRRWR